MILGHSGNIRGLAPLPRDLKECLFRPALSKFAIMMVELNIVFTVIENKKMTDKRVDGVDTSFASPNANSLADKIRQKLEGDVDIDVLSPEPGVKRTDSAQARKRTVKDLPALDEHQTRRITLDSNASYGMKVRRPPSDESGSYRVLSAPEKNEAQSGDKDSKPGCPHCGIECDFSRLTCSGCGNYLTSTVQESAFEKGRDRARKTGEMAAVKYDAELTLGQLLMKRSLARTIDLAILLSPMAVLFMGYFFFFYKMGGQNSSLAGLFQNMNLCFWPAITVLALIIYNATFESSLAQASPGKIAMGLSVVDKDGKELTFSRAFMRAMIMYLPLTLMVMTVWFTRLLNPALESLSVESFMQVSQAVLLVGVFAGLTYLVNVGACFGDRHMRTLFDLLAGTRVVKR